MAGLTPLRLITATRTAYGLLLACRPDFSPELVGGPPADDVTRRVVQVLGVRHLGQAALTGSTASARALRAGALVDTLHAASMLPLAVLSREHRRAALVSAAGSSLLAMSGVAAARRRPRIILAG